MTHLLKVAEHLHINHKNIQYINEEKQTHSLTIHQQLDTQVTDQSDKVQQVHARFVGLGVSERQQG